jgi:hypothetical protein
MAVGFWFEGCDAAVETKPVAGVVECVGPLIGKYKAIVVENNLQVDVKLNDGRVAHVMATREQSPKIGDHIQIAEHIHGTGRHTFSWK